MVTKLEQLSEEMFARDNREEGPFFEAAIGIQVAEFALRYARDQLVRLGGDGAGPHGDTIQKSVLDQIDAALERQ